MPDGQDPVLSGGPMTGSGDPDLYDYDVYISGIENAPVGAWDIMSRGFVHPSPVLKQFFLGSERLGTNHRSWIDVTDLRDIIDPLGFQKRVLVFATSRSMHSLHTSQLERWS